MKATIIGANGFIGSHLAKKLTLLGYDVEKIGRDQSPLQHDYGVIIYCAGIKSDFISRAYELVQAHVTNLMTWLKAPHQKFIYLSSARIYMGQHSGLESTDNFNVNINDLYNQSKILGESICTALDKNCTILRPTNVIGVEKESTSFLWQIFKQAILHQTIQIQETGCSTRDYISLQYLLDCIVKLIETQVSGIYNVSSGINISNSEVCQLISTLTLISNIHFGEKKNHFPVITNDKIVSQTNIVCPSPSDAIRGIYQTYLKHHTNKNPSLWL